MKSKSLRSPWGALAVLVAASGMCIQAQSDLVFQDTFDLPYFTDDINDGIDTGRQSGTAAPVPYTEDASTMPGGDNDFETTIYFNGADNVLSLWQVTDWTWVSPNRNFTDGPTFSVEFDLSRSVANPAQDSTDWAAIVFGATFPGAFVNSSDGMGILFRSNGGYQVFNGATAVYENPEGTVLPADDLHVRIEVSAADFAGSGDAVVSLFVNDVAVPLSAEADTYTRPGGFLGNYLTLQGYAATGNQWEYWFNNLTLRADTCVRFEPQTLILDEDPAGNIPVEVYVSSNFNGGQPGTVTLTSNNPNIVQLVGAQDNQLTLNFTPGGPISQTVNLAIQGRGRAYIYLSTDASDCVSGPLLVETLPVPSRAHVVNPSFEADYNAVWPHYGTNEGWTGGSGSNRGDGPFHDNGTIPDRGQIAFQQGTGVISQELTHLEPGENYWVQVRYNARGCCGGETPDMTVSVDGVPLGTEAAIAPAAGPYYFRNFEFVPTAEVALLEIATVPHAAGDSTLLFDAVTVVKRGAGQVVVQNPSFEASGSLPLPGTLPEGEHLSGWQTEVTEGAVGLNLAGDPYADNGDVPDQDLVAFIQGAGSLSQTLVGLIPGETYQVDFACNARTGSTPHLLVTADEAVLFDDDVNPVGEGDYHQGSGSFVAASGSVVLRFAQTAEGDQTVLLDDIRVSGEAVNLPCIQLNPANIQVSVDQISTEVTVKLLEDVVANGPATVTVTSSDAEVAMLPGAVDGTLTLIFDSASLTQTVEVAGVAPGTARLLFTEPRGVCFDKPGIDVLVLGGFVRNPSFEANSHPSYPGYGPINSWSSEGGGNTGINGPDGPFHDNGLIPDRRQVALLQTEKTIRQEVVGLTPGKQYWLQFYYNARNCCGGIIDLFVRFGGDDLATIASVAPVLDTNPYHFKQIAFTATAPSGTLEFQTLNSGDATVLLDAVTIVQRDPGGILVRNPSFEASGLVPSPGYIDRAIAGWDAGGGGRGVNLSYVGPFADNGVNPDQDNVLFLQGEGTFISQTLTGLTAGENYTARFAANGRSGNAPVLKVLFDGAVAFESTITPVGEGNPYHTLEAVFTASGEEGVLRFEQTATGDQTVLLDNVVVVPGGTPAVRLSAARQAEGMIRLSWPASAEGYVLQETAALPGGWTDSTAPVTIEGNEKIVMVEANAAARFYRLKK